MVSERVPLGFGDFLRGSLYLHQVAKKYRRSLIVDFTQHPIGNYLVLPEDKEESESESATAVTLLSDAEVAQLLEKPDRAVHLLCNLWPPPEAIGKDAILYMQSALRPNADLQSRIRERMTHLGVSASDYRVVHIRAGDQFLVQPRHRKRQGSDGGDYDIHPSGIGSNTIQQSALAHIRRVLLEDDGGGPLVLMSDYLPLTKALLEDLQMESSRVCADTRQEPVHLGFTLNKDDSSACASTLVDFFLLRHCSHITQLSTYPWCSGFSRSCSTIFDVDLDYVQIK